MRKKSREFELMASADEPVSGQVGLGVDIVEIARMKRILERTPSFARKVFSCEECCFCDATTNSEVHYAMRFAAKEAVVKALGTGFSEGIGVRDIEVKRTSSGKPYAHLSGHAKEIAQELGVREFPISLSYTHIEAIACAMAITNDSVRATNKRKDPAEELVRQFKEARSLLDEIPSSTDAADESFAAVESFDGAAGEPFAAGESSAAGEPFAPSNTSA